MQDDVASDQDHLSPLSPLQEEWLDGQSPFVSDDENEGTNTAEDEARYSSADEREHTVPRRRRAYVSKGVYTSGVHGRDYAASVNESKYSTAAAWVQAHMLEESVCSTCSGNASKSGEGELSLQEMTTFIRRTGIPDALAGSGVVASDGKPWEEALSGGTARPRLNISKSHEPDGEVTDVFGALIG